MDRHEIQPGRYYTVEDQDYPVEVYRVGFESVDAIPISGRRVNLDPDDFLELTARPGYVLGPGGLSVKPQDEPDVEPIAGREP